MNFNKKGNVIPTGKNIIEYEEFLIFYSSHKINKTRRKLLSNFKDIVRLFKENSQNDFKVWVGGSFITTKDKPQDIDAVFFLNTNDYNKNIESIQFIYQNADFLKMDISFKNYHKNSEDTMNQYSIKELENIFCYDRISDDYNFDEKGYFEISINV